MTINDSEKGKIKNQRNKKQSQTLLKSDFEGLVKKKIFAKDVNILVNIIP